MMKTNPAPIGPRTVTVQMPDVPARQPLPRQEYLGGTTVVHVDDLSRLLARPKPSAHCPVHGSYWPMYVVDGVPSCPYEVTEQLLDGTAEFPTDEDGTLRYAEAIVAELDRRADLMGDRAKYDRPIHAASLIHGARIRRSYDELVERLAEAADVRFDVPMLLTIDEVAAIFRVSERTVRRWAGQQLPAPVKIGRRLLFKADAIGRRVCQFPEDATALVRERDATEAALTAARRRHARHEAAQDLVLRKAGL